MSETSTWAPLRHRAFRSLWIAGIVVNLAIWMQNVGAAWLMTELDPSPLMVSLVQTAMALPAFLLGLPGGVLADLLDRRRLLLLTQVASLTAMLVLSGFAFAGSLGPWSLLMLTFALGASHALSMAAWMAAGVDAAPRHQVPAAVALSTISPNVARVVGPALAGVLITTAGTPILFLVIASSFVLVLFLTSRWKNTSEHASLPPETLLAGMRSGLRYIRHSDPLRTSLRQVFLFATSGSAIWALLPLVAKDQLGIGAGGFGVLLGSLGAGAVIAALNLARLHRRFGLRRTVIGGGVVFAAVTLSSAYVHDVKVLCAVFVIGGMSWMAVNTTIATIVQTSAASWVRARVASVYLLVIMGAMAAGGVLWGLIAQHAGVSNALALAGVAILGGLMLIGKGKMILGKEADFRAAARCEEPLATHEISHDDGPVSVEIGYRIDAGARGDFVRSAYAVGKARRRNGASNWRLYRDLTDPNHYVERFIVESWLDYLRHGERATQGDWIEEENLRRCQIGPHPVIRRFILQSCPPE